MRVLFTYTVGILCYSSIVSSMKISSCASWNRTGITVIRNGVSGSDAYEYDWPSLISIHKEKNTLYVGFAHDAHIIQGFALDQSPLKGTTVLSALQSVEQIYIDDDDGPTIYVTLLGLTYVQKWIPKESSGVVVGEKCPHCYGLSADAEKNLYMSSPKERCVYKWSPQTNTTAIMAGRINQTGSTDELLFEPKGIYVDKTNGAIYIADKSWHRIQKWSKGAQEGVTVAGSNVGEDSNDPASLLSPTSVFVDEETKIVYITDTGNNRIQKLLPNATKGETIAGGWETTPRSHAVASHWNRCTNITMILAMFTIVIWFIPT